MNDFKVGSLTEHKCEDVMLVKYFKELLRRDRPELGVSRILNLLLVILHALDPFDQVLLFNQAQSDLDGKLVF